LSVWDGVLAEWGAGHAAVFLSEAVAAASYNRRLMGLLERCSATPAAALAYWDWVLRSDFVDVFRNVRVPTRVLYLAGSPLPEAHERQVRRQVDLDGGRLIKVMGDGTLSLFDGPSRAVRCALAICDQARELGIEVRAGAHTGEVEHTPGMDVSGMTVHIGAR